MKYPCARTRQSDHIWIPTPTRWSPVLCLGALLLLPGCAGTDKHGTLAELESVKIELVDTKVDGGLEKAMQSYQKFLEQTPESAMTPEAIRRLADLKVEKEYGVLTEDEDDAPHQTTKAVSTIGKNKKATGKTPRGENDKDFESRATKQDKIAASKDNAPLPGNVSQAEVEKKGAEQAIDLYKKLLEKYPLYKRNDQVLYQLSRAYEELGRVEEAMEVMNRLYRQFPNSRYLDEVHFRRGEYYFTRKRFLDAEEAYDLVLKFGIGSVYYERALYKKGWTFYKQELYERAIDQFITLLDHKVSVGYDFEQTSNKIEQKRISDTFRVISLGFSNLGGATTVQDYFAKNGSRSYEDSVYRNLGEFYFAKRRYSDAAATYNAFVERNQFHKASPHFSMRVIEIYLKGGFPRLVIEGKRQFAKTYGLTAEYWNYFDKKEYPEVIGYLKENIFDLANHYHSLYQKKKFAEKKQENFAEASHWYKEYLDSFPKDVQSPKINYQFADLLLENKDFNLAAIQYERTAYDYPVNPNSHKAAYAAVFAYREYLKVAPVTKLGSTKREIVRSSLRLVDAFPKHEKATVVLGAAVDDLFAMRDFEMAVKVGRRLIKEYPKASPAIRRGAWLVVAHSSFDLKRYNDAELAYIEVLNLTDKADASRLKLIDNLAASIYKQGEQAKDEGKFKLAVKHFLRIAAVAPGSEIRQSAEYDAAAVLMQIKDYQQAITVLLAFRKNFPGHKLQKDITKKIAFVYKELKRYALAAVEFEKIANESDQEELIRDALLIAAEMYEKADDLDNTLRLHKQFVAKFPKPVEFALETHNKIALIYKKRNQTNLYHDTLRLIISIDSNAGEERTERTRYLAATAALTLTEPEFDKYAQIKLVEPLKKTIKTKKQSMKALVTRFSKLVDYKVGDVTAAATFYLAEIYYNFSRSLMESEKPKGLSELELEEFKFALEEQAYPFEEKTINVHEKNVELLGLGIYSKWIDRSIEKLAKLVPARYAKPEESTGFIADVSYFRYVPKHIQIAIKEAEIAAKKLAAEKAAREAARKAELARQKLNAKNKAGVATLPPDGAPTTAVGIDPATEVPNAAQAIDSASDSAAQTQQTAPQPMVQDAAQPGAESPTPAAAAPGSDVTSTPEVTTGSVPQPPTPDSVTPDVSDVAATPESAAVPPAATPADNGTAPADENNSASKSVTQVPKKREPGDENKQEIATDQGGVSAPADDAKTPADAAIESALTAPAQEPESNETANIESSQVDTPENIQVETDVTGPETAETVSQPAQEIEQ